MSNEIGDWYAAKERKAAELVMQLRAAEDHRQACRDALAYAQKRVDALKQELEQARYVGD